MKPLMTLCVLFALVTTAAADDYVVILLDTSGSTGEYMRSAQASRLDVAKKALSDVLTKLPDTTKVGLVTFDGWVCDLQPVNKGELSQRIASMRPSGNTPLYKFMKAAADRLLEEREKQANVGTYKLLVITDGEATDSDIDGTFSDGSVRPGVLVDIVSRNVTVDVIGLDMKENHSLKNEINGQYMRGDDPASLTQAVKKAVAEVGFGTGKDVSDEAFADIAELPEPMAVAIIQGITTFPNHPIGEKAPIRVVMPDGTVQMQPAPEPVEESSSGSFVCILVSVLLIVIAIVAVVCVVNSNNRRYY